MSRLNINTDAVIGFVNKLEKLSKTTLPRVVKETLNTAALDLKQNTMPKQSAKAFVNRQPNFFKANSNIDFAKNSSNINSLRATVGFISSKLVGSNNYAVKDLEQQENGGTITNKAFIPTNQARKGNNNRGMVKANAQLAKMKQGIVNASKSKGKNDGQRFGNAVRFAGKGGFVMSKVLRGKYAGKKMIWRVNSLNKTKTRAFKLTALYEVEGKRNVKVIPTGFMKKASIQSGDKLSFIFIKEAQKRIDFSRL